MPPEIKVTPVQKTETIYERRVSVEMTEAQWLAYKYYAANYAASCFVTGTSTYLAAKRLSLDIESSTNIPENFFCSQNQDKL